MPTNQKVQRWIDLTAALLRRHYPATFAELAPDVPAYSQPGKQHDTLMRMFERDKDELRALGVPIETVKTDDAEAGGAAYQLSSKDFYLPYLCVALGDGRRSAPRKVDRYGYQALASLAFEPDELAAVRDAAVRALQCGDPTLAAAAESAMRKLAFDLPVDPQPRDDDERLLRAVSPQEAALLGRLGDALARRKAVAFDYHAMSTGRSERRTVEPYGLFFAGAAWYLAAFDRDRQAVRNFRVSRMQRAEVNARRAQSADYEIPADFRLREHAGSRRAWELGDGDSVTAVVEFRRLTGAAQAAARLGEPVAGHEARRRFHVRRVDAFARWLLSFGGDAVPLEPEPLVDAYAALVRATRELYA